MDQADTKQDILAAALSEFARAGKDGARMQDIADRAGINKAMLHYYFRSKDGLYEEVLQTVMTSFMKAISHAIEPGRPFQEQLRGLISTYVHQHAAQPEVSKLWMQENLNGAPVASAFMASSSGNEGPKRVFAWLKESADRGFIRPVDPVQFMMSFIGSVVIYMIALPTFAAFRPELLTDPEAHIEARIDHLFELFYNGMRPA